MTTGNVVISLILKGRSDCADSGRTRREVLDMAMNHELAAIQQEAERLRKENGQLRQELEVAKKVLEKKGAVAKQQIHTIYCLHDPLHRIYIVELLIFATAPSRIPRAFSPCVGQCPPVMKLPANMMIWAGMPTTTESLSFFSFLLPCFIVFFDLRRLKNYRYTVFCKMKIGQKFGSGIDKIRFAVYNIIIVI